MRVNFSDRAIKELEKLDKFTQKKIKKWQLEIETLEDPRQRGKGLVGNLSGYWRYRIENYRLICKIFDEKLIILCVEINKRDKVYG